MIDIHSHILPGVDDGARSLSDSLAMLELAAASGTTDIVATPHANDEFPYNASVISSAFEDLAQRAPAGIRLHLGCDFHLNARNLNEVLRDPSRYTINRGRYLLVELPEFIGFSAIEQQLDLLVAARLVPVITHPERNASLQSSSKSVAHWVARGCLVQLTAQSLLGNFGRAARRLAESLMQAQLAHCIASDAHDCLHRSPNLLPCYQHVSRSWGSRAAQLLFLETPAAVVADAPAPILAKPSFTDRLRSFVRNRG